MMVVEEQEQAGWGYMPRVLQVEGRLGEKRGCGPSGLGWAQARNDGGVRES